MNDNMKLKVINDDKISVMFDNDRIREHKTTYNLNITGPAKVGKTYFASKLDEPLFFDFYCGGCNGLSGVYVMPVSDNIIGNMGIFISHLIDNKAKEKYTTLIFDGFERMLDTMYNEVQDIVRINYWQDSGMQEKNCVDFMRTYLFNWFSILTAKGYNIVLINGKTCKNRELDSLYQNICYFFKFKDVYIHFSNIENENGIYDRLVGFNSENQLWK